jgi:hypothetical protein
MGLVKLFCLTAFKTNPEQFTRMSHKRCSLRGIAGYNKSRLRGKKAAD